MDEFDADLQTPAEAAEVEESSGEAPADAGEQVEPETSEEMPEDVEELKRAFAALKADRDGLKKRIGEFREEIGRWRALLAAPAPAYPGYPMSAAPGAPAPVAQPAAEPEIDVPISEEEWYANPKAAAAKVAAAAARKAAAEAAKAAREEAARVAQLTQMEQQFFATYPELKKYPRLVNAAATEVAQKMAVLDPYRRQVLFPDPMKAVADLVKQEVAAIAEEARTKPQTTPPLHVAGGGGAVSAAPPKQSAPKLSPEEEAFQEREAMYYRTLKPAK